MQQMFEKKLEKHSHDDHSAMKDKFMTQRYSVYLNKCMFVAQDDFIKKKHQAYMDKIHPKTGENFFKRMEKDQERRIQNDKIIQERLHSSVESTYNSQKTDFRSNYQMRRFTSKMSRVNGSRRLSSLSLSNGIDSILSPMGGIQSNMNPKTRR